MTDKPKGVEGVGQTARELAREIVLYIVAKEKLTTYTAEYERVITAKLEAYAAAQTLTLRAELHWFRSIVAKHFGYDAPGGDGCNPLDECIAELRSRLQEAGSLLADCRTYFTLVTHGGWTDVSLIQQRLTQWLTDRPYHNPRMHPDDCPLCNPTKEDSNAPRS